MIFHAMTYLRNSCARHPDKPALADGGDTITYGRLWRQVCAAAPWISAALKARRRPVFVCIGRRADSAAALFSVACSGCFYVPIDPSLPDKRLLDMFQTVRPALVITTGPLPKPLPFPPVLTVGWADISAGPAYPDVVEDLLAAGTDTDPLYCIFTSGSTGIPKGVLVSHRSVIDMIEQFCAAFGFDGSEVFGNQAPFDFDVSVKDLYLSLAVGGTVQILEKKLFLAPRALIERMEERRVNTIIWAASAMKLLSALQTFDKVVPAGLRRVMFSGEVLPAKVLNDWMDHLPNTRFFNLYGPTEITCNCTWYPVTRRFANGEAIPIGRSFGNCRVFLLDGGREITALGQPGELCVRGSCLALGYYSRPDITRTAFCQNPLQPDWPEPIYRTGDLAQWNGDGDLVYVGRADSQVKHMGHRIELGEVELAVNALLQVDSACCLYWEEKERLCLFYQAPEQDDRGVLNALKKTLPDYMIPNRVYYFERLPENRTGKIDRAALRAQYFTKET